MKFEKYKKIKKELQFSYRGYPIEKVIALDLIVQVYVERNYNLKSFLKHIYLRLEEYITSLNLSGLNFNEPSKTLFSMGMFRRQDYYEIWRYAKTQVKNPLSFDFSRQKTKKKVNLNHIFRSISIVNQTKGLSLLGKLNMSSKISYYMNVIDEVEKNAPKVAKYCAFSSVHEHETILTYYFKKRGIPTFSLQHGLYTIYKKQIPLDSILYDNLVSDYHLCWGKSTKDEFIDYGVEKDSLLVAGYPRKVKRPPVPETLNEKKCLVLMARYSYHHSNLKLVEMLEKFSQQHSIRFYLKLHPSLFWEEYRGTYEQIAEKNNWELVSKETTISDLLKSGDFGWAIAVNTTTYYEAYSYNVPCLRFNDGTFEDTVDIMPDQFSNLEELNQCFGRIPFNDSVVIPEYFEEVDRNLDYAIGINTNEYAVLNV